MCGFFPPLYSGLFRARLRMYPEVVVFFTNSCTFVLGILQSKVRSPSSAAVIRRGNRRWVATRPSPPTTTLWTLWTWTRKACLPSTRPTPATRLLSGEESHPSSILTPQPFLPINTATVAGCGKKERCVQRD